MITKLQEMKWSLHNYKSRQLLLWGLKNGYIAPYNDELIEKLRNIYDGGIPASILLLSNGMSNGHCYDRALLMSRAFLDGEDDVQLVYATIDSLKLNPQFADKDDLSFADHCIVERIMKDGQHLIYDTSSGFVYDKKLYWLMEHPKIRKINKKSSIIEFVKSDEYYHPEDIERDKYASPLILPMIEMTYGSPTEMYSHLGIELLQREIEHFKPYGKKRIELSMTMPLIMGIAQNSGNQEFINELNDFITLIQYDEEEVYNQLNEAMQKTMSSLHSSK